MTLGDDGTSVPREILLETCRQSVSAANRCVSGREFTVVLIPLVLSLSSPLLTLGFVSVPTVVVVIVIL